MLSFRVMRLVRPQPHLDAGLKLDLLQDTGPDADTRCLQRFSELSRGVVPKHLAQRAHAETYADLQAPGDVMSLPANFGYVYIGETFRACVVASSVASASLSHVAIKVELARGERSSVLYDSSGAPLHELAPGDNMEAVVKQDIKELGAHTLNCSATFTSDSGDRTLYSQTFKFTALPPLTVRTKVRAAGPLLLLEACVDNGLRGPLLLRSTRFLPAPGLAAQQLEVDLQAAGPAAGGGTDAPRARGPLDQYISSVVLVPARGSYNLLYGLTRTQQQQQQQQRPGVRADASGPSNVLGRLELHWSGLDAEAGRLQTQPILGTPASLPKPLAAELLHVPPRVRAEQPFEVRFQLVNSSGAAAGPLTIAAPKLGGKGVVAAASGQAPGQQLLIVGPSRATVPLLQPRAIAEVALVMLGLQPGYARSPPLLLQQEGRPVDCIPEFTVLVEPG